MFKSISVATAFTSVVMVSGCVSVHSFVEEKNIDANAHDLAVPVDVVPVPVQVQVEFQRNGVADASTNPRLEYEVERALDESRVFRPVTDANAATLKLVVDDRYSVAKAASFGTVSGISQGFIGNSIMDNYLFTLTLNTNDGKHRFGRYHQNIETVLGRANPWSSGQAHSPDDAFAIVVQHSIQDFIADRQAVDKSDLSIMFVSDTDETPDHESGALRPVSR